MPEQSMLHFTDEGGGKVLVCIHGFLESAKMWNSLSLPASMRKITLDLPGHGQSPSVPYETMEELADRVMTLLDALTIDRYEVIGHSMGGYVGLELLRKDARCTGLTLLNSNPWSDDAAKQVDRQRVAALVMHSKKHFIYEAIPHLFWKPEDFPDQVEALIRDAAEMEPEAIALASLAMSRRRDLTEFVREAGEHIWMIQGEGDAVVPLEKVRALKLDEACYFALIPQSGHMSLIEQPERVKEVLSEKWK